jgi:hypothetical protein
VPAISVSAATEETRCITVRLGNTDPIFIRRIRAETDAGLVQTIVYRSSATTEVASPGVTCTPFAGLATNRPIFMTNRSSMDLSLPNTSDGSPVGIELAANQMIQIEAHFYNASGSPINSGATLRFDVVSVPSNGVRSDMALSASERDRVEPRAYITRLYPVSKSSLSILSSGATEPT